MRIHPGWIQKPAPEPTKPTASGIEPRICDACKRGYVPTDGQQVYCTAPNCVRDRNRRRQQERRLEKVEDTQSTDQKVELPRILQCRIINAS